MATQTKEQQQRFSNGQAQGSLVKQYTDAMLVKTHDYVPLGSKDGISLSIAAIRLAMNPRTKSGRQAPDEQILKFILLCKARALNPYESDAYLLGYEGDKGDEWSIITSVYAFLKRAEVNPEFDGYESGVIVKKSDGTIEERPGDFLFPFEDTGEILLGGWCKVYRKDRKHPTYKRVSFATYGTGRSRWKDDPAGMICKVAEVHALRDTFPTTLGGLYIEGEMQHTTVNLGKVEAKPAERLTAALTESKKTEEVKPAEPATAPDGEIVDEQPPAIDDAEKAALAEQEAQEAAYDASTFNPETASKEELIAAIKPHLERLKKKETWLCTQCGLAQRELVQCTEAGLRAAYRFVSKEVK